MTLRRTRALVLLATGILLVVAFGFRVAGAKADTTLGSYSVIASAPGMEFTEDEPSAQAHPEGQGDVPYTTSLLTNGGVGYALSTIAWPGAYGGNAGSLVLVALPSTIGPVPRPDAVTDAVKTVSPALQYPIRAEARAGSTPDAAYSQIPGTTLTSHADGSDVHALADVQGVNQPGAATYGNLHSDSSSTLNGNSVKALANSVVHDVNIAGGAVKIKSLTSTATATTDGSTSSSNGGTVVSGLTVGGQPASIDQDGLHIGTSSQPANATAAAAANQVLTNFGMKVFVSQPQTERTDGGITYQASSVVWTWIPPGDTNKNVFILTLGGARVSVSAGSGFDVPSQTSPDTGGGVASPDTGSGDASALGSTAVSGDTSALPATGVPSSAGTATRSSGGARSLGGVNIAKTFGGVGAGWLLAALAGAALVGFGASRLIADLVDSPPATCPLEVRR